MNWTRSDDLRAQVQKWWDRGELLAELVHGAAGGQRSYPRRLVLKGPTSAEMADRFDEVRAWIAELRDTPRVRIEVREFAHRVLGANAVPQAAWVDSPDDAWALIGKRREASRFASLCDETREHQPLLLPWLAQRPLRALELADQWRLLLDVVAWMEGHPRPGIYLRQVDIPGVHTKFIEAHRGVLMEWLDAVLPPLAIDATKSGPGQFAARYGFRDKPARVRLRVLDAQRALAPGGGGLQDITLDATSFARLPDFVDRVFVTENETNFLAFPAVRNALVIFGAGYGWDTLAQATWLKRCTIHYWGDIDTHGFAILNQLRSRFDHVESLLMDRATLMAHRSQWGREDEQVLRDLPRLSAQERALFDDLRDNRIRANLRLEQEMIGYSHVKDVLRAISE